MAVSSQIAALVEDARQGRAGATDDMVPLLYAELRRMARGLLRRERPGLTLQTTDLLHEACVRLLGGGAAWENRAHFMGAAALAMRRLLVRLANEGVTIFLSTHSLAVAEELCGRIGILDRGKLVALGSLDELRAHAGNGHDAPSLETVFLDILGASAA